jgi:hypothetical protein
MVYITSYKTKKMYTNERYLLYASIIARMSQGAFEKKECQAWGNA